MYNDGFGHCQVFSTLQSSDLLATGTPQNKDNCLIDIFMKASFQLDINNIIINTSIGDAAFFGFVLTWVVTPYLLIIAMWKVSQNLIVVSGLCHLLYNISILMSILHLPHSKNQWVVLTICLLPELHNFTHPYYQEPMGS